MSSTALETLLENAALSIMIRIHRLILNWHCINLTRLRIICNKGKPFPVRYFWSPVRVHIEATKLDSKNYLNLSITYLPKSAESPTDS